MVNVDEHGFPVGRAKGKSRVQGLRTGDLVRAVVTKGKRVGHMWGVWGSKPLATSKLRGGMAWWKGFMRAIVRPSIAMMVMHIRKERRRFLPVTEVRGLRAARLVKRRTLHETRTHPA